MQCEHWKDCGVPGGGCCGLGLFDGKPSLGICSSHCTARTARPDTPEAVPTAPSPPRGLGDTLAGLIATATFGRIAPCLRCRERQETLNRLVPYPASPTPNQG